MGIESLLTDSKSLDPEAQAFVQENFWSLVDTKKKNLDEDTPLKFAVRYLEDNTSRDDEYGYRVLRDDGYGLAKAIASRDDYIRQEERQRCEDIVCGLWPDKEAIRRAIMGGKK